MGEMDLLTRTRLLTRERVEAAARVIDPMAFNGSMLRLGCGGFWHYEGHSSHSTCPGCGSGRFAGHDVLAEAEAKAQERARRIARNALRAAANASRSGEAQRTGGAEPKPDTPLAPSTEEGEQTSVET